MTRPIRSIRILSGHQRRSKKRTLYTAQNGHCATCNTPRPAADLILKHKIHRKQGGDSTLANLYLICHPCNRTGHRAVTP
ncbi:HNH endonuclease signature motif containing protein [Streptomyces sp. NPDC007863]|uniref:HNH endonuclease n=1 Tax=Streptomyces sp. NPDC007863 TaxID=3154894 RepID=UPI0034004BE3